MRISIQLEAEKRNGVRYLFRSASLYTGKFLLQIPLCQVFLLGRANTEGHLPSIPAVQDILGDFEDRILGGGAEAHQPIRRHSPLDLGDNLDLRFRDR